MGYRTDFTFDYENKANEHPTHESFRDRFYSELQQALKNLDSYYPLEQLVEFGELNDVKWYAHDEHMKIISKRFSNVLFTLTEMGEDGEQSQTYYKDGKMQEEEAQISFNPFDETKLK